MNHHLLFGNPVRLFVENQFTEIHDVDEALRFLDHWPLARRGPVYHCAVNCCHAAIVSGLSVDDVEKSFESFAHITGILADTAAPRTTMGKGEPKPLTK